MKYRRLMKVMILTGIACSLFGITNINAATLSKQKSQVVYTKIGTGIIYCSTSYITEKKLWSDAAFAGYGYNGLTGSARKSAPMYNIGTSSTPRVEAYGVLTLWAGAISDYGGARFIFTYTNGKVI